MIHVAAYATLTLYYFALAAPNFVAFASEGLLHWSPVVAYGALAALEAQRMRRKQT